MNSFMLTELRNDAAAQAEEIHREVKISLRNGGGGGGKSSRQNSDDSISPRSVLDACTSTSDADVDDTSCTVGTTTTTYTYTEPSSMPVAPLGGPLWKCALEACRTRAKRRLAAGIPALGPTMSSLRSLSIRSSKWRFPAARRGDEHELCVLRTSFRTFSLSELKKATRNFSKGNVVGRGAYAKVYRGTLPDGQLVAVKKLSVAAAAERDRVENFLSELGNVVNVRHPNVAMLVGVGVEGGEHLVFPFSRVGCLSRRLHCSDEDVMTWEARYRVAMGAARGIEYLHERCARRIVHRDIKPANILLRDDYHPLICDFGLARWLPAKMTHYQVTIFEGTFGYVPPEYTTHGIFNEKTDVYAYGVVLLELITGRRAIDGKNLSLVTWARAFLGSDKVPRMVDPALGGRYDVEQLRRVAHVAEICIQAEPTHRPRMSQVAAILRGEETHQRKDADETSGYDALRYMDDLSRHKALAFDFDGVSMDVMNGA